MLTPEGLSAGKMDKIMLLSVWAKHLSSQQSDHHKQPMICAGMGKPTYPLHAHTRKFLADYWRQHTGEAINYGHPQGDFDARLSMARAMSKWYDLNIDASKILFTVGGAGALRSIFSALKTYNKTVPNFRVITPFPFYSLYKDNDLRLHPIHVMNAPGYNLTAEHLLTSIRTAYKLAKRDKGYPRALLICDPNNPLGTVLNEEELKKIANVLRDYPDLIIILDEAYAEMVLDGTQHRSLLKLAPDLKKRIIVMRSATKGLSAAGERMAVTIAFNEELMHCIVQYNIRTYGHAPRSLQIAYAETMNNFNDEDRKNINEFYGQKVAYVTKRLVNMGAAMPDKQYQVAATFYVLGHFAELIGEPIDKKACAALETVDVIRSDEDIAYSLLFENSVMLAPGSYFGLEKDKGYLRITCSGSMEELQSLMDRLERRLKKARLTQQVELHDLIHRQLSCLKKTDKRMANCITRHLANNKASQCTTTLELKKQNKELKSALLVVKQCINQVTKEGRIKAATLIQSAYRAHLARKSTQLINQKQEEQWQGFVDLVSPQPSTVRSYLQQLTVTERLELSPWKKHLQQPHHLSPHFLMKLLCTTMENYSGVLVAAILVLGLSSLGALVGLGGVGITTASAFGVSTLLMGIGFFSTQSNEKPTESNKNSLGLAV